ncbi:SDR family NAD(P)-dependent oxidoreductase, partial [Stenotrophomonas maltophilia]
MDLGLNGKRALVTAASRGLGRASALALAAEGARVAVAGRKVEAMAELLDE